MTNRTTADLREAIRPILDMIFWTCDNGSRSEEADEAAIHAATRQLIALLPQPPALGGQVCQDAKNKIVAAILRYPPETMTEAERIADDLVQAIVPTQEEWRPFKGFSQIEENATYEVTDGNHHWFAQKEWFDDDTDGGWLFSPCLRNGEDDWREDEPIIDSEGRNSITHFKPVLPLPPGGDNG